MTEAARIRAQVVDYLAALKASPEHWKKASLVRVQCRDCSDLAAEVLATPYLFASRVVVHRGFHAEDNIVARTGDRQRDSFISVLFTPNQDAIVVACRCGRHRLDPGDLFAAVSAGTAKLVNAPDGA